MARRVETLEVTSVDDLDIGMQEPIGGWRLYNGRDDWFEAQVNGLFFQIPPDKGDQMVEHPFQNNPDGTPVMVRADGILHVKDVIGQQYRTAPSGGPTSTPDGTKKRIVNTSREVAQFILKNYGTFGIALLKGTTMDERIKSNARKAFTSSQLEKDKLDVVAYEAVFAAWKKSHPDQIAPPPPEPIRLAKERIDENEATRQQTFVHVCPCGSYATNNFENYARHARLNHGKIVKAEDVATSTTSADVTPQAPRRGRPPKTVEAGA